MIYTPHDYQRVAAQHLYAHRRCALWAPMGGGKTVVTLTALQNLSMVEPGIFPALVLAPVRVAKSVWPQEVEKWDHLKGLRVVAVCGSEAQRKAALYRDADIYTMNYENIPWLRETVNTGWNFATVVADEFTRLKSFRLRQGGARARALAGVTHTRVKRFIGLTGTPSPNGIADLWGQIWFLDKGERLGPTYTAFTQTYFFLGYDGYTLTPTPNAQAEVQDKLRDICLTITALPVDEPIVNSIEVELPPAARKIYKDMAKHAFAELAKENVTAVNAAVKTMKLAQLASGAIYTDEKGNWEAVHDAKIEALDSVIEEANGAPVLVAYHFKSDLARLLKAFPMGRVLDKDPKTIVDWNNGKIRLLFAHPASAGHGLNLAQGGNILVFFSLNWNLEEHLQIIERIGPLRQKQAGLIRPVFLHYIAAKNTIDQQMIARLVHKKSVQDALLEAMKANKEEN